LLIIKKFIFQIECPENCDTCEFSDNSLKCSKCKDTYKTMVSLCEECDEGFTFDENSNFCICIQGISYTTLIYLNNLKKKKKSKYLLFFSS